MVEPGFTDGNVGHIAEYQDIFAIHFFFHVEQGFVLNAHAIEFRGRPLGDIL